MTALTFPDNTALLNFALIRRMDLLERLVNGKGVWCATVAHESDAWVNEPGFEDVGLAASIFGEPLTPTRAEHLDVRIVRDSLAGPGDGPLQHLGEAETIVIARSRFAGSIFVTDDGDAQRAARLEQLRPVGTGDLLDLAVRVSFIDEPTRNGYEATIRRAKRIPARWSRT